MKAKFIYEKFTDESDPIRDMGIGLCGIYNNLKKGDILQIKRKLPHFFPNVGDYLLITHIEKFDNLEWNTRITSDLFHNKNSLLKALKNPKQTNEKFLNWGIKYQFFKSTFKYIPRHELTESLNEKFVEDSDPIKDLGIGMIHQIEKFVKLKEPSAHRNEYLWTCAKHGNVKYVKYLISIGENVHFDSEKPLKAACIMGHKAVVKVLLEAGAKVNITSDKFDNSIIYAMNHNRVDIAELLKTYTEKQKDIKENVNEKFTDESDPIEDMSIGLPAIYNRLKKGDILQIKRKLPYAFPRVGEYLLITKVEKYPDMEWNTRIHCDRFRNKTALLKALKNPKQQNDQFPNWGIKYEFFKNTFKYIPRDKLKESLNEKFTDESDPIRDLGIGGIDKKRNFDTRKKIIEFTLDNLAAILKTDEIPNDIIFPARETNCFVFQYYYVLVKYFDDYIRLNHQRYDFENICIELRHKLQKIGYPKD